ncbi:E3 ubiquitin-protein ligase RNF213-like [Sphaerodactylus townsendi]|uniref:E3 ubiquitin-protein ligase RNF213-like n=1 Tax=Sphaerodactylus townsendi TaxID=933632 RepID=UPI002025DD5D|nr:E3 ubiquitin-protein ligase RNF213-like [Sphaerodactylus townsendi]
MNFGDDITVYFHAILSKDFKLDPKNHKVFVRAQGISGYRDWNNVCELTCSENLGQHGYLLEGWVTISKDNMNKWIPYKYYVLCGKGKWEFIYKVCHEGQVVNRCMFIPQDKLSGTEWHQYDDIICADPDWWNRVKERIPGMKNAEKNVVEGKQIAAKVMLKGLFSMLHSWTPINVKNFFQQFYQFYSVNSKPWIHDGRPVVWTALEFGAEQVKQLILDYLRESACQFIDQNSTNSSSHNTLVRDKLGLALIFLQLGERYNLPISDGDLIQLCRSLCLEKPREEVKNEIHSIKDVFSDSLWIKRCLIDLYNSCIEKQIHQWVWTIPVHHLFSASIDSHCFHVNSLLDSEERWAGLEGLMFAEYRNKWQYSRKRELLKLMKEKKSLVQGDRALYKSWFSLLPLRDLIEFLTDFSADLLDCLVGTFHRLKNVETRWNYEL